MKKILIVSKDGLNETMNDNIERAIEDLGIGRFNIEFCGIEISSELVVDLNLVKWADLIIIPEKWQRDELFRQIPEAVTKDVRVLDILEEDLENKNLAKTIMGKIFR